MENEIHHEQKSDLSPLTTNNFAADFPLSQLINKSVLKRQRSCQTSSPQLAM